MPLTAHLDNLFLNQLSYEGCVEAEIAVVYGAKCDRY